MATSVDVAICLGKSCRKRPEHAELNEQLTAVCAAHGGAVIGIACSGICKGPVVVVDASSDHPLVLARVRSRKAGRDVGRMVGDDTRPSGRLRDRAVGGGKRATALRRVAQARARLSRASARGRA